MPRAAAPPRPARRWQKVRTFQEVGLHQFPSERKGEGVPVPSLPVPSHVPRHPQTATKVRGFSLTASGFTAETDWPLEEAGFEPSVRHGGRHFSRPPNPATRNRHGSQNRILTIDKSRFIVR